MCIIIQYSIYSIWYLHISYIQIYIVLPRRVIYKPTYQSGASSWIFSGVQLRKSQVFSNNGKSIRTNVEIQSISYWCVLRRLAGWVAGGCWDYYDEMDINGSFPKIPCVKRTSKKVNCLVVDLPLGKIWVKWEYEIPSWMERPSRSSEHFRAPPGWPPHFWRAKKVLHHHQEKRFVSCNYIYIPFIYR